MKLDKSNIVEAPQGQINQYNYGFGSIPLQDNISNRKPDIKHCKAKMSTTQNPTGNGAYMNIDTYSDNTMAGTNGIIIPRQGNYNLYGQLDNNGTLSGTIGVAIYVDGIQKAITYVIDNSYPLNRLVCSCSITLPLVAGNIVKLFGFNDGNVQIGESGTFLEVQELY